MAFLGGAARRSVRTVRPGLAGYRGWAGAVAPPCPARAAAPPPPLFLRTAVRSGSSSSSSSSGGGGGGGDSGSGSGSSGNGSSSSSSSSNSSSGGSSSGDGVMSRLSNWLRFGDAPPPSATSSAPSASPSASPSAAPESGGGAAAASRRAAPASRTPPPQQQQQQQQQPEEGKRKRRARQKRIALTKGQARVLSDVLKAFGQSDDVRRHCAQQLDVPVAPVAESADSDERFWWQVLRQFRESLLRGLRSGSAEEGGFDTQEELDLFVEQAGLLRMGLRYRGGDGAGAGGGGSAGPLTSTRGPFAQAAAAAAAAEEEEEEEDPGGAQQQAEATSVSAQRAHADLLERFGGFVRASLGDELTARRALLLSSDLRGPHEFFPAARALAPRRIVYHSGPTNSGKTHAAMERLAAARNGVYCAPLRLLALEGHERLNARGVPCNLLTGQEQRWIPGARHVSCTVEMAKVPTAPTALMLEATELVAGAAAAAGEGGAAAGGGEEEDEEAAAAAADAMAAERRARFAAMGGEVPVARLARDAGGGEASDDDPFDAVFEEAQGGGGGGEDGEDGGGSQGGAIYDVAVIDEIQMIGDEQRGSAWSRALMGLPAREVHLCGDASARDLVRGLAELMGDSFEEVTYERRTSLRVAADGESLGGNLGRGLRAGDCVVAFSRKQLHSLKLDIEARSDLKCCLVYGSLPPETRAQQAALFNDEHSGYDVLLATDAIGMGLNLNIGRVIFYSTQKFNGREMVPLTASQARQIGGRAGRFGSRFPQGVVSALHEHDLPFFRENMGVDEDGTLLDAELDDEELLYEAGLFPSVEQLEHFASVAGQLGGRGGGGGGGGSGSSGGAAKQLMGSSLPVLVREFVQTARLDGRFFVNNTDEFIQAAAALSVHDLTLRDAFAFAQAPVNQRSPLATAMLAKYARTFARGEPVAVDVFLKAREGGPRSDADLKDVEEKHKILDAYTWLGQRFPESFVQLRQAEELRARCVEQIEMGLQNTAAFTKVSRQRPRGRGGGSRGGGNHGRPRSRGRR